MVQEPTLEVLEMIYTKYGYSAIIKGGKLIGFVEEI